MGILKDAILDALKEQGVKAEWVGEKPRVLKTAAQSNQRCSTKHLESMFHGFYQFTFICWKSSFMR